MVVLAGGPKLAFTRLLIECAHWLARAHGQAPGVEADCKLRWMVVLAQLPEPAMAGLLVKITHWLSRTLRE